jgi:hypothetical protein
LGIAFTVSVNLLAKLGNYDVEIEQGGLLKSANFAYFDTG